eukprot:COSAG02_NODE_14308_length_1286_cov_2.831047_3_plen_173_part_00
MCDSHDSCRSLLNQMVGCQSRRYGIRSAIYPTPALAIRFAAWNTSRVGHRTFLGTRMRHWMVPTTSKRCARRHQKAWTTRQTTTSITNRQAWEVGAGTDLSALLAMGCRCTHRRSGTVALRMEAGSLDTTALRKMVQLLPLVVILQSRHAREIRIYMPTAAAASLAAILMVV